MKKTIAILLVLVLVSAGLFADLGTSAASGSTDQAQIKLLASVAKIALFGISSAPLATIAYESAANFTGPNGVVSEINIPVQAMTEFESAKLVGYLAGINNSGSTVTLGLTISDFESATLTEETPIALTVSPTTKTIPAATTTMGVLASSEITVIETTAGSIQLAPAAEDWTATVTISVTSGA